MKYSILFFISIFSIGCHYDDSPLEAEDDSTSTIEDNSSQEPWNDDPGQPIYRMGCNEGTMHSDSLGNIFYLPILCQEHYIDTGRPSDKNLELNNKVNYHYFYNQQSFSDFEG